MIGANTGVLFLSLMLGGCFSQVFNQPSRGDDPVLLAEEEGLGDYEPAAPAEAENTEKPDQKYHNYISRLLKSEEAFRTAGDSEFLRRIPDSPESGSVEEAALAVGLVRYFLHLKEPGREFNQADIDLGNNGSPGQGQASVASLEELVVAKGFNFPAALTHNSFLKTYPFQIFLLKALRLGSGQSQEFVYEMRQAIRKNVEAWSRLSKDLDSEEQAEEEPGSTDGGGEPGMAPALPFGGDVFAGDEARLKQAQSLTEQGHYQEAVTLLQSLPEDSLYRAEADNKIREISNLAVQDLRRKAARAFQSARPISDFNTRAAYLKDAKKYLEQALEVFPASDQLRTVRQNLEVINKSLELMHNSHTARTPS